MNKQIQQIEPWIGEEEISEVVRVLRSGWITEAGKTKEFEEALSRFTGSKYVSIVSNGTVSLYVGLSALGVKAGDEVILPDFTMVASANAIVLTGAKPVFVDIDRKTLCMDISRVAEKITRKTKAIMPVSLNGRSCDIDILLALAKKYGLFVIEDAAQALGSKYNGKHLGTFGDIGSFSFSTPKVITTGQGGALVTDRKDLHERILRIKDFGRINRNSQDHDEIGYNFKFTDILAAVGVEQMKKLSWRVERKKEMYKLYQEQLFKTSEINFITTNLANVSPWFIDILVPDPISLQNYLKDYGIGTRLFYPAIHATRPYKSSESFPNSLWVTQHGIWLPSSSFLTDFDIIHVCKEIKNFYGKKQRNKKTS